MNHLVSPENIDSVSQVGVRGGQHCELAPHQLSGIRGWQRERITSGYSTPGLWFQGRLRSFSQSNTASYFKRWHLFGKISSLPGSWFWIQIKIFSFLFFSFFRQVHSLGHFIEPSMPVTYEKQLEICFPNKAWEN